MHTHPVFHICTESSDEASVRNGSNELLHRQAMQVHKIKNGSLSYEFRLVKTENNLITFCPHRCHWLRRPINEQKLHTSNFRNIQVC